MHHKFGDYHDSGIPSEHGPGATEALVETEKAILCNNVAAIATMGDELPLLGLCLGGRVNNTDDTFSAMMMMRWEFAGFIVGEILQAAMRAGPEDYRIVEMGIERSLKGMKDAEGQE